MSPWIAVVLVYPLVSIPYRRFVRRLVEADVVNPLVGRYGAAALPLAIAAGYLLVEEVRLTTPPFVLGFLPIGFFLYGLETRTLSWLTRRSIADGSVELSRLLPLVPVAIAEEILFREALSSLIARGALLFVGLSALAFGAIHLPNLREATFKIFDGVVYATMYVVTGSVVAPILAHVGFNLGYVSRVSGHLCRTREFGLSESGSLERP